MEVGRRSTVVVASIGDILFLLYRASESLREATRNVRKEFGQTREGCAVFIWEQVGEVAGAVALQDRIPIQSVERDSR